MGAGREYWALLIQPTANNSKANGRPEFQNPVDWYGQGGRDNFNIRALEH
jgi:hypothetical protein